MNGVSFQPVRVALGATDTADGFLVFADRHLLGVLVRLEGPAYGDLEGGLHLEAAFGGFGEIRQPPTFQDLGHAQSWFEA
jgi:hypothetical protein